jgi:hypothetical protein
VMLRLRVSGRAPRLGILFGYRDPRTYREVAIRGGRWRLSERINGRTRRFQSAPGTLRRDRPFTLGLVVDGPRATFSVDGAEVLSGAFRSATEGRVGVVVGPTTLAIEEIRILGD